MQVNCLIFDSKVEIGVGNMLYVRYPQGNDFLVLATQLHFQPTQAFPAELTQKVLGSD
jgi:hypothetical protein